MSQLALLLICIALVAYTTITIIREGQNTMKSKNTPPQETIADGIKLIDSQVSASIGLTAKDKETLQVESELNAIEDDEYIPSFLFVD